MSTAAKTLVKEREEAYAEAWRLLGEVIKPVSEGVFALLQTHSYMFFVWIMILNKLLRILGSPTKKDHWLDIQGYAELVLKRLNK